MLQETQGYFSILRWRTSWLLLEVKLSEVNSVKFWSGKWIYEVSQLLWLVDLGVRILKYGVLSKSIQFPRDIINTLLTSFLCPYNKLLHLDFSTSIHGTRASGHT